MGSNCIVSSVMGSDCIVDVSESASQRNTVEMFSAPTITEDSKSYTTYDRRSIEDFDYRLYDVSTRARIHTHTHMHIHVRVQSESGSGVSSNLLHSFLSLCLYYSDNSSDKDQRKKIRFCFRCSINAP